MNFYGKVIIVTGASKGIGKVLCEKLCSMDAKVVGVYNTIEVSHDFIDYQKCDIASEEDIKRLYDYVLKKYHHVDYLINGAAICLDSDILEKTKAEFMKVIEVNLVGTFLMCKYALLKMDKGVIVNISSLDATKTYSSYSADYASSKAGLETLTKTLALRCPKVKVIGIAPAWVDTETVLSMNPNYLKEEMERNKQSKLLKKEYVADKIIQMLVSDDYKSGIIYEVEND